MMETSSELHYIVNLVNCSLVSMMLDYNHTTFSFEPQFFTACFIDIFRFQLDKVTVNISEIILVI